MCSRSTVAIEISVSKLKLEEKTSTVQISKSIDVLESTMTMDLESQASLSQRSLCMRVLVTC